MDTHKQRLYVSVPLDSIAGNEGRSRKGALMTTGDPTVALIHAAAQRDAGTFAAKMADSSLEAAVDIWLRRVARRKVSPAQRARLMKGVERGVAAETKDVQLTRAALLRAAGLDDRPAASAAYDAGATYAEIGAVLGMTQQGASARLRPYRDGAS